MINVKHIYKQMEKNILFVAIGVAGIIIIGALILSQSGFNLQNIKLGGFSDKAIAEKAVDYINNNKLSQDTASLDDTSISGQSGLIKFKIKVGTNSFDSYATRDGKLFFPQAFELIK